MESSLDINALNDLIKLADASTKEALEKEKENSFSPVITRAKSLMKNVIPDNFNKVKFSALRHGNKQPVNAEEPDMSKQLGSFGEI